MSTESAKASLMGEKSGCTCVQEDRLLPGRQLLQQKSVVHEKSEKRRLT